MNQKNAPCARIKLATLPTPAGCSTDCAIMGACLIQLQVYIYTNSLDLQISLDTVSHGNLDKRNHYDLNSSQALYVMLITSGIFEVIRLVKILVLFF